MNGYHSQIPENSIAWERKVNEKEYKTLNHDQVIARIQSFYDYLKQARVDQMDLAEEEKMDVTVALDDLLDEFEEKFITIIDP